jgi:acyl carrier protein
MKQQILDVIAAVVSAPAGTLREDSGPQHIAGWNSLSHITMISALEENFQVEFAMKEIMSIKSVGDVLRALREKGVRVE